VCCAAQENGTHTNYVSALTGATKSGFSRIHWSVIFYLIDAKVAVEVPNYQGRLHTRFGENRVNLFWDMSEQTFVHVFFYCLSTHLKNCSSLQTCIPIHLKFGTIVGYPAVIIRTNCGENLYKILRIVCVNKKNL